MGMAIEQTVYMTAGVCPIRPATRAIPDKITIFSRPVSIAVILKLI